MTDPTPAKPKMSRAKKAGIAIGVVIGVAVAGILVLVFANVAVSSINNAASNRPPSTITVSGSVDTTGFQTHPVGVTFHDQSSSESEFTQVAGDHYQIDVPNGSHNWRVIVEWEGIGGSSGRCDGGFVQYDNTYSRFITQDVSC